MIRRKRTLIDTSGLIDGRVSALITHNFLTKPTVISSVIDELHTLTSSKEDRKRLVGHHGLDVFSKIQKKVRVLRTTKSHDVDTQLLDIARNKRWVVYTTDHELTLRCREAGVSYINPHELARDLQQRYRPGDLTEVVLASKGEKAGQAVGYAPDGSNIVVSKASQHIGTTKLVRITDVYLGEHGSTTFGVLQ